MADAERWGTLALRGDMVGAELLRSVLTAHDIPVRIEGTADRAVLGFTSGLSVQVPEDRLAEAAEIIAALENAGPTDGSAGEPFEAGADEEQTEEGEGESEDEQAGGAEPQQKTATQEAAPAKPALAEPRRSWVVTFGVAVVVPGGATFLARQTLVGLSLLLAFVAAWFAYLSATAFVFARGVCLVEDLLVAWRSSRRAAAGKGRSPFGQLVIGLLCWPPILAAGWFGGGLDALARFDRIDVCSPVFECWSDCGEDEMCADRCLNDETDATRAIVERFADCSDRRCGNVSDERRPGCEEDHCADELAECTQLVPKTPQPPSHNRFRPRSDWP